MCTFIPSNAFYMGKFELYLKSYLRLTSSFIHTTIVRFLHDHLLTLKCEIKFSNCRELASFN